jgi:hypothetical protein
VDEGSVRRVVLFPVEFLGRSAQESLLQEFGGRRPSMAEVASLPEDHLLKLAGFGPSTIQKVRSILQGGRTSSSSTADWSDEELLSEHGRLSAKLEDLRDEFKRKERELQQQLRAVRLELRIRGLSRNGATTDKRDCREFRVGPLR